MEEDDPEALDLCRIFNKLVNFDLSVNMTFHKFKVPLVCFEIIPTIGVGLYFDEGFLDFFGDSLTDGAGIGGGSSALPFASKIKVYKINSNFTENVFFKI